MLYPLDPASSSASGAVSIARGLAARATAATVALGIAAAAAGIAGCAATPPPLNGRDAGGGGSDGPLVTTGTFALDWEDNFDSFDSTRWQLMTHSFDSNLAQFSTTNTRFQGGIASLLLTPEPTDTAKPYRGVEMRSRATLTYGKVESRVRFAPGSGVISALVLIYTPWPADDWNELDIEYLGRYKDRTQLNAMVYTGPPVAKPATQSVAPTQFPEMAMLPFDPSADFHTYTIEWTPAEVRFTADGTLLRTWKTEIGRLRLPQNILMTIWASSAADWAGPIQPTTAPASADYDWLRVYRWVPDAP